MNGLALAMVILVALYIVWESFLTTHRAHQARIQREEGDVM